MSVRTFRLLSGVVSDCFILRVFLKVYLRRVQSSPGYLQVGQVPSNWTRHIPQTSSSGISHRHDATAFHSLMVTFIMNSRQCQFSFVAEDVNRDRLFDFGDLQFRNKRE